MTIGHSDDELDQLLREHYHAVIDGVTAPEHLLRQALTETRPGGGRETRWTPVLAFALAGASFLIILASSRAIEVLLSL
ncbi:MAG TPA: hypothetical protein VN478_06765 [Clostridia bacterium]|nr:hypothetical protein [Clostridia bacterium]